MARTKGSPDIAPMVRGAFKRALLLIEQGNGKDLSTLLKKAIEDDGILKVMDALAKYVPKEMDITTTELTPEKWLEYMADGSIPESIESETEVPGPVH